MLSVVSISMSCDSNTQPPRDKPTEVNEVSQDSPRAVVVTTTDTVAPLKVQADLKKIKVIEVLSGKKEVAGSTSQDDTVCFRWALTPRQITTLIRKFDPMSGEMQNMIYSFYPCQITGELKLDGIKYKYWLGAGSTLTLRNADTTLYYAYTHKDFKKYFISGEDKFDE